MKICQNSFAALVNKLVPWCAWLLSSALEVLRLRLRLRLRYTASKAPMDNDRAYYLIRKSPSLSLYKTNIKTLFNSYYVLLHLGPVTEKLVKLNGANGLYVVHKFFANFARTLRKSEEKTNREAR